MTDCTTRVDALATSNEATAMFSGGSSSTETSRTIVPARASASETSVLRRTGRGRASLSSRLTGTNRSSAESASSVSPLAHRWDASPASHPRRARAALPARAPTRGAHLAAAADGAAHAELGTGFRRRRPLAAVPKSFHRSLSKSDAT